MDDETARGGVHPNIRAADGSERIGRADPQAPRVPTQLLRKRPIRKRLRAPRGRHRIADPDRPARTPPKTLALLAAANSAGFEGADAPMHAPSEVLRGPLGEPALNEVEPGRVGSGRTRTRGRLANQAQTSGVLWVPQLSMMMCTSTSGGTLSSTRPMNMQNSTARWLAVRLGDDGAGLDVERCEQPRGAVSPIAVR